MISEEVEMTNGFALGVWEKKALQDFGQGVQSYSMKMLSVQETDI